MFKLFKALASVARPENDPFFEGRIGRVDTFSESTFKSMTADQKAAIIRTACIHTVEGTDLMPELNSWDTVPMAAYFDTQIRRETHSKPFN